MSHCYEYPPTTIPTSPQPQQSTMLTEVDDYVRCARCRFGGCDVKATACGCAWHAVSDDGQKILLMVTHCTIFNSLLGIHICTTCITLEIIYSNSTFYLIKTPLQCKYIRIHTTALFSNPEAECTFKELP